MTFIKRNRQELFGLAYCTALALFCLIDTNATWARPLGWIVGVVCAGYWVWAMFDNQRMDVLENYADTLQARWLDQMAPGAIVTNSTFEDNVILGANETFIVPDGQDLRGVTFRNNRVLSDAHGDQPHLAEDVCRRLNGGDAT